MHTYRRMNAAVIPGGPWRIGFCAVTLLFLLLGGPAFAAPADGPAGQWGGWLLDLISDPNIAFVLLLVGVYGILIEFFTPGIFAPGVVGLISLILALIAFSTLPVQLGALGLLLLGIAMMAGEAFVPSGALGLGGVAAFVIASLFLFEPASGSSYALSLPLVIGAAIACAAISLLVIGAAIKARQRKPKTGAEQLIGSHGHVVDWRGSEGTVHLLGEHWSARSDAALEAGSPIRVVAREGLTLTVEPAKPRRHR
jgi:membrane-bound serine protease (ClpP class)